MFVFLIAALTVFPCKTFTQTTDIVFAVGDNSTLLQLVSAIDWMAVPIDSIPGCGNLLSVWGSSDHDVYVAGCYDELLHFDGTRWQKIAMTNPNVQITAVSGTGPDNIYAGGFVRGPSHNGLSYQFDGLAWSEIPGGGNIQHLWADPGNGFFVISRFYDWIDRYWYHQVGATRMARGTRKAC